MNAGLRGKTVRNSMMMLVIVLSSADAQSSRARLVGTVRDTSGIPVPFARLTLAGLHAESDTAGRFSLGQLPAGDAVLTVRRLGFMPHELPIELVEGRTDSLGVILRMVPNSLDEVTTEGINLRLTDFYRHRQGGAGTYLERSDLEARGGTRLSDVMRRLPGVRIGTDRAGRFQLRMSRASSGRDCPPDYFIDGLRAPFLTVDDVPLADVEALELYRGPAGLPPEFQAYFGNTSCGVIAIWTRTPG